MTEEEAVGALRGDDPARAARAAAALWAMWGSSGDTDVDGFLANGIQAMERRDFETAERLFTRMIEQAPDFAEGWNKRATLRYVAGDYHASIVDCEETLRRKPHHFGALSGQGLCHMALGEFREAATLFRRTLDVYPHLTSARQNLASALGEAVKGNGHG